MKKFCRLKLFGLGIVLTIALVFMGISFLEAKKPQKWTWSLKIPGESILGKSYNLFGYEKVYQNTDNVRVGAKKYKGGPTTGYYLSLDIINNQIEETCVEGLTEEKIGFRNLDFFDIEFDEGEINYCHFPPSDICETNIPDCMMECFLEQYPHPNCGYYSFTLLIRVDYDIEKINTDNPVPCSGKVYIDVRNTFDVLEYDDSAYHNILSADDVTMEISRDDPDTWTVTINDHLDFKENYKVKKGKKNWEYKNPLRAKTWFSFETTWMRDQK